MRAAETKGTAGVNDMMPDLRMGTIDAAVEFTVQNDAPPIPVLTVT